MGEAMQTARSSHFGCLLVSEDDELVGIFTERDLRLRIMATRATDRPISDFMTPGAQSLETTDKSPSRCTGWTSAAIDTSRSSRTACWSA